ncbi:ABC transporter permease [Intestinibacillus sp. Marseille-P6563]|uniref:ABC transporter permease n=1 Tax=Intestinibacillus sp. Marseille-P6563 TaxID=2364792 RepID=UPI000F066374|nr:ABC transporter permease [Intestinibacillus sp. Marseille-P6563]
MTREVNQLKKKSQAAAVWRRLRKNKMAILGLIILSIIILAAIFANFLFDYETMVIQQNASLKLKPPSAEHWLGTDEVGRDILARIVFGARVSLPVAFATIAIAAVVGGLLGAIAGYGNKYVDNVIMRVMDVFLAIPSILLSMALVSALGTSMFNLMLAISISNIAPFARIVRSSVLTIRNEEYIEAARAIGASDVRIILRHIIPNCMAPIIVQATLSVAGSILAIASLSFIGLGIAPPTPEWGSMLSGGRQFISYAWWVCAFPGIAIMLTILSLNLLGDGLRDALDPKLKN